MNLVGDLLDKLGEFAVRVFLEGTLVGLEEGHFVISLTKFADFSNTVASPVGNWCGRQQHELLGEASRKGASPLSLEGGGQEVLALLKTVSHGGCMSMMRHTLVNVPFVGSAAESHNLEQHSSALHGRVGGRQREKFARHLRFGRARNTEDVSQQLLLFLTDERGGSPHAVVGLDVDFLRSGVGEGGVGRLQFAAVVEGGLQWVLVRRWKQHGNCGGDVVGRRKAETLEHGWYSESHFGLVLLVVRKKREERRKENLGHKPTILVDCVSQPFIIYSTQLSNIWTT